MALRHMTQTCTSSFLQTKREFLSVRRLGRVLDLKSSSVRLHSDESVWKYTLYKSRPVRCVHDSGAGIPYGVTRGALDAAAADGRGQIGVAV